MHVRTIFLIGFKCVNPYPKLLDWFRIKLVDRVSNLHPHLPWVYQLEQKIGLIGCNIDQMLDKMQRKKQYEIKGDRIPVASISILPFTQKKRIKKNSSFYQFGPHNPPYVSPYWVYGMFAAYAGIHKWIFYAFAA